MSSLKVIENKISAIQKYLKILDRYKKYSQKEIEEDITIRGALERYLYLAVQATIDLADAVIAYRGFRKPTTFRESFAILNEEEIIPLDLTEIMVDMVGFRNAVTHDYENLDYDTVYDVLKNRLQDIEKFIAKVEEKIK